MGLEHNTDSTITTASISISAANTTPTPQQHESREIELQQTLNKQQTQKQDVLIPISPDTTSGDTGYLSFLEKLHAGWKDCPNLTITYKNLSYTIQVPIVEPSIRSFLMQGYDKFKKLLPSRNHSEKMMDFVAMAPTTGMIRSGTNTLILAPPGHGKSTFLKALAGRLNKDPHLHGEILYNGMTPQQAQAKEVHIERLCTYVGQTDIHFPVLTVKETMNFVVNSAIADTALLNNPELTELSKKRAELMISMLGLDECQDTIIGNDLLRGISGGQKRRISLGEMLVTNARVMLLDEVSTGLDSAVTFHIFNALRTWTRITKGSIVTALLQPTPETYALFDDIILMKDGVTVYHGPRDQVATWFKEHVGITIPSDADEAGWIVDYLTDPVNVIKNMVRNETRMSAKQQQQQQQQQPQQPIEEKRDSVSTIVFHDGEQITTYHPITTIQETHKPHEHTETTTHDVHTSYQHTATTTDELYKRYQSSTQYEYVKQRQEQHQYEMSIDKSYTLDPSSWSPYTLAQYGSPRPHSYLHHLSLNLSRQKMLVARNTQVYKPRIIQSIFTSFVYGTLFITLPIDDFQSKLGLMLLLLMAGAFANMTELPTASEARAVVTKQIDAGFIPPVAYVISVQLWSLPLILVEVIISGTMLYWIPSYTPEADRFFFWLLTIATTSITMSTFFRVISYVASNPDIARQMDYPFIIIFMIFGGYLIPYGKIPRWLIWLYWSNPLSWAYRSLALNEFNSARYDYIDEHTGKHAGDAFLDNFDVNFDSAYKWAGIGYLWGFCILFIFISAYALATCRPMTGLGTKRLNNHKKKKEHDKVSTDETVKITIAPNMQQQDAAAAVVVQPVVQPPRQDFLGDTLPAEVIPSGSFQLAGLPFTPAVLSWRNLKYTVQVGKGKDIHDRVLLQSISGFAAPFTLTALMGASGAGKTTLMDVIAGRKTTGKVEGEIFVNGKLKETESFNRLAGYVEQQDLHMGLCTVREALLFSAKLRLPTSVSDQDRQDWVEQVMMLVGLTKIADRLIGDATTPGLSPGQLKLVTIGVEMVANPSILFLDEPTSGLDAPSALRVMKAVRRISQTGRSVVCTIHQPSAELFYMFNRLLLLRPGGECVFFADIGEQGEQLVSYFNEVAGPEHPLPALKPSQNPANWMLDVVGAGSANPEGGPGSSDTAFPALDYAMLWKQSQLAQQTAKETEQAYVSRPLDINHTYVSTWVRYWEVQVRYFIMHWRNGPTNLTRVILQTIMGVAMGLIYLQLNQSDFQGIQSFLSVIFLGVAFPASISAQSSFPSFFRQRAVYYRESTVGMYDYKAFSTAMLIVEIPFIFFSLAFFVIPFYFMIGLQNDATLFFKFYFILYIQALVYSCLSQLWMSMFPSSVPANIVNSLFMSLFFMFGGLIKKASTIPAGWKWFYYIDPIPKTFIAASLPQLYCDGDSCPHVVVPGVGDVNVYNYLSSLLEGSVSEYWPMIGWLILTIGVIRILNLLFLKYVSHIKR